MVERQGSCLNALWDCPVCKVVLAFSNWLCIFAYTSNIYYFCFSFKPGDFTLHDLMVSFSSTLFSAQGPLS